MKIRNFWLNKVNEKVILRVFDWAHRQNILVEDLTEEQIIEASQTYIRDSAHS